MCGCGTMVISGRNKDTFAEANFAKITKKLDGGSWKPVSTNESWDVFWCEMTDYDGEKVELRKFDGRHEIKEDSRGEYLQITQEHNGLFASGEYTTRFRPYLEESRTSRKWWMPSERDTPGDE